MKEYDRTLAKISLEIGAIKLRPEEPFTWASGYRMPIYNDNRMLLGDPEHRELIANAFESILDSENLDPDFIAGTSTAGIPHSTTLSDRMMLPMVYIRDKPKDHGMKNQIEGIDAEKDLGGRVGVVIEDLISTGGSSAKAVQAVRDANGKIDYCLSIFNYGLDDAVKIFKGEKPYDKEGNKLGFECNVRSILTYDILMDVAAESGKFTEQQMEMLKQWRADPSNWGEKHGFPKVVR